MMRRMVRQKNVNLQVFASTFSVVYNRLDMWLWDYNRKLLEKSEKGKILLLERLINYGPGKEKINLAEVKMYWNKLNLLPRRKRLLELILSKKTG